MIDERVVERWLDRGARFFRAVTKNRPIRTALLARGLTKAELQSGWGLYATVVGVNEDDPKARVSDTGNAADRAMVELDAWDSPNFNAAGAVLDNRAPNAKTFLFSQLVAAEGPAAVVAVETFLNRRDALKSGDVPGVSPEEAKLAVALLAERRIVDDARAKQLRGLIDQAQSGATPLGSVPSPRLDEHAFQHFRAWLHEWREVARGALTRRDYQIALGLASRRTTNGDAETIEDDVAEDDVAAPAPS